MSTDGAAAGSAERADPGESAVPGESADPGPGASGTAGAHHPSPADAGDTATGIHRRRRRRFRVIAFIALAVVVYFGVIALYASSGRVSSTGESLIPEPGGVTVVLSPQTVNATAQTIGMELRINDSAELRTPDSIMLANPVSVIISPVAGNQTVDFAADTIPGTQNVSLSASGEVENWPFDRYDSQFLVIAYTTVDGVKTPIPTNVVLTGSMPGWTFSAHTLDTGENTVETASGVQSVPYIVLSASRSSSTVAFGIVLLALLIVTPVLVLIVAITAYRGKRKVEASFNSWMGAMLFATIPLRTFLPGSPPIGSWIDYLIVLWVIVALVTGLAIYVAAWMRWGTPGSRRSP